MKQDVTLLKEYVRSILTEKAIEPKAAIEKGLSLTVISKNNMTIYVLFDGEGLYKFVSSIPDGYETDGYKAMNQASEFIYGAIWADPKVPLTCPAYGAREIVSSVAKQGYGPMMYDIAMSFEKIIMSDRNSVSAKAIEVWKHYKNNRDDVEKLPLDDHERPETETPVDDAQVYTTKTNEPLKDDPRNFAYKAKNPINVDAMLASGEKALEKYSKLKTHWPIYRLATAFFDRKYNPR